MPAKRLGPPGRRTRSPRPSRHPGSISTQLLCHLPPPHDPAGHIQPGAPATPDASDATPAQAAPDPGPDLAPAADAGKAAAQQVKLEVRGGVRRDARRRAAGARPSTVGAMRYTLPRDLAGRGVAHIGAGHAAG